LERAATKPMGSGRRPRMVNSRRFELQYDLESVGPSGIGRVELWATRDDGKTWRRHAVDENRRSPMTVCVEDEGVYGFCVVVTNGAGLGGRPPQSGDAPDICIYVDVTPPTAHIQSAKQGIDDQAGRLILSWQSDDAMPADRPISLSYRATRNGPWHSIASGLENTGSYVWPLEVGMPPSVYLRLEVRDAAGNVGEYETPDPVVIDQSRPKARIRDVLPTGR
jgi:hypothetical protein